MPSHRNVTNRDGSRRRIWSQSAANRAEHQRGVRLTLRWCPRRQVVRRTIRGGRIVVDRLDCGHAYTPSSDRRRTFTRTRRCHACGTIAKGHAIPLHQVTP